MTIWVVCAYWGDSALRESNFAAFADTVRAAGFPIMLVHHGRAPVDLADATIRITEADPIFQKERFWNIGLAGLPSKCTGVIFSDIDVLPDDLWEGVPALLAKHEIVQAFSVVDHVGQDGCVEFSQPSAVAALNADRAAMSRLTTRVQGSPAAGFAWAARRDFVDRRGFYELCVVGGGDTALVCALYGDPGAVVRLHSMNAQQTRIYAKWAARMMNALLGYAPTRLVHLWHGDVSARNDPGRHARIAGLGFDPVADLRTGPQSGLCWTTEKPELHAAVAAYVRALGG